MNGKNVCAQFEQRNFRRQGRGKYTADSTRRLRFHPYDQRSRPISLRIELIIAQHEK
jgi:hypothetical protein